jgi:hypothetical protein
MIRGLAWKGFCFKTNSSFLPVLQSSIASIYKHTLEKTASKALASSTLAVTLFSHYERSEVISHQNLNSSFASISSTPSIFLFLF